MRAWASVGVPPEDTGLAPQPAIPEALERAGMPVGDVSLWEINEAFASVSVAATRALGLDEDTVNVLGGGCGLGHPVAMTGTRMVLTLAHELRRRGGGDVRGRRNGHRPGARGARAVADGPVSAAGAGRSP